VAVVGFDAVEELVDALADLVDGGAVGAAAGAPVVDAAHVEDAVGPDADRCR
jgi:hypothetical protein